jgi:hypothetical protein
VGAQQYRDAYFLFGSGCRLLAGKISTKDYKTILDDLWSWSKRKVDEMNLDVPDFAPPQTEKPAPVNSISAISAELTPERRVEPPRGEIVYISDEQTQRFAAHCRKQGLSESSINNFSSLRFRGDFFLKVQTPGNGDRG